MLSDADLEIVRSVHRSVLSNFKYLTDKEQYQQEEWWIEVPEEFGFDTPLQGDCEDFAKACRKLLWDEGIDNRLIICRDETGAGHCVLEAGGYILDNRQLRVFSKKKLERKGYKWWAISGYKSGEPWFKVKSENP